MEQEIDAPNPRHQMSRVRFQTHRRMLTVATLERLTPRMLRVGFTSEDLGDFASASFDDHIKLFFPSALDGSGKPCMRDFTPRAFEPGRGTLVVDFALHEDGPAMQWASSARVGQTLEIGGPRGSRVVPDDFDWYLLIGDETALPAIGRRVEELRAGVPVTTVVVVADSGETQAFRSQAAWTPVWVLRPSAALDDAALLRAALTQYQPPSGEGFVWIAAEASAARSLRSYMVDDRGHPKAWTKASGYWKQGQTEVHETIDD